MISPLGFDFVISYNQENTELAERVHRTLEAAGLVGWIDQLYYCVPNQPLEQQLAKAWSIARFIIVLIPVGYRDSEWCQAEYGQGLTAENDLPLKQVLVLYELSEWIPQGLRRNPSFLLTSEGLEDLRSYICNHQVPILPEPLIPFASERWKASQVCLEKCRNVVHLDIWQQLRAINTVCGWIHERLIGEEGDSSEAVSLLRPGPSPRKLLLQKESILSCALSDDIRVDAIPFQHIFYDAVHANIDGADDPIRLCIERVMWDQLVLLCCAPNRFFREQMLEVAGDLGFRAAFALQDDPAHKHFNSLEVRNLWSLSFQRSKLWSQPNAFRTNLNDGERLASPIEHALLSHWQSRRSYASRLLPQLSTAERVALAGKASLLMMQRFVEEEILLDPHPRHAQLLGIEHSHTRHHLAPNLYLEMFYYRLVEILGGNVFRYLSEESIIKMKNRLPPYSVETLMAVEVALRSILPRYVETLEVWLLRRGGAAFKSELVLDFVDNVIGPFAVLSTAQLDTTNLQAAVEAALAYFGERGDAAAKAVAALIVSKLDRPLYFDTAEFEYQMIQAIKGSRRDGLAGRTIVS